ncbi:MAG: flagellar biosynthetic protein FliO [Planctomycetota bacterium]
MRRLFFFILAAWPLLCVGAQQGPQAVPSDAPAGLAPEFRGLGPVPAVEASPLVAGSETTTSGGGTIGNTVASLAAVIGLVVVCAAGYRWVMQRSGALAGQPGASRSPGGILDVLGRYPVGRGQTLLLMKVDRRVLLVAQSAGARVGAPPSMATLCEIADPDEVASIVGKTSASGGGFAEALTKAGGMNTGPTARADGVEVVDLTGGSPLKSMLGVLGARR